jgi:hypothetical protein
MENALEKELQICEVERKSGKRPMLSWANNQMGNPGL